jgi:hypothetical protein
MQRQIIYRKTRYQYLLKWEQALIIAKFTRKKNIIILQKHKVANTRETAHLPETLKQKPKESEDMKKGKTSTPKISVQ